MSVAPLPVRDRRHLGGDLARPRRVPSAARIRRRHWAVVATKWLLPAVALLLLASVALWPEIDRLRDQARVVVRHALGEVGAARMIEPRYRSLDERNRPYTLTAETAEQAGPDRVNLDAPKGDVTLGNGTWLMLKARHGVFVQHGGQLDLSGDVELYRDDGTTIRSATATMDLKQGAGAGNDPTHAEGPFGTLDAQGFALADKGAVIQFPGPGHAVLNGANR